MPTIQKLLPLLIIIIISFSLTCSQSTEPNPPPFKDPREMTWTVDTLAYPRSSQTLMTSIWASSPTDVWICGHNDRSKGNLWHYDGEQWTDIYLGDYIPRSPNTLNKIDGVAPNNIWVAGERAYENWKEDLVVNYNGNEWIEHDLNSFSRIIGLYANSFNNVWICGDDGIVANYNGASWGIDTARIPVTNEFTYFHKDIAVYNGEVFLITSAHNTITNRNRYYFIRGNSDDWTIADSLTFEGGENAAKWGMWGLYTSSYGKLYSYGPSGIWEWNDERWEQILDVDFVIQGMFGMNEDYIIAVGQFENIYFYDGITWVRLNEFVGHSPYFSYTDVWTDGYNAFIIGYSSDGWPMKTFIWKGE